jgi:hydroxymethyl cephem carbamoyltransferase
VKILSYNPGHDGAIAYLQDTRLEFSIESEKDSNYRYSHLSINHLLDAIGELDELPEIIPKDDRRIDFPSSPPRSF